MAKIIYEFVGSDPIVMACETKDIDQLVEMTLNMKEKNEPLYPNHEIEKREGKDIKSITIEF